MNEHQHCLRLKEDPRTRGVSDSSFIVMMAGEHQFLGEMDLESVKSVNGGVGGYSESLLSDEHSESNGTYSVSWGNAAFIWFEHLLTHPIHREKRGKELRAGFKLSQV